MAMDQNQHIRKGEDEDDAGTHGGECLDASSAGMDGAAGVPVPDDAARVVGHRAPSRARGVGLLDLLSAPEWRALARAAGIDDGEVDDAFRRDASPSVQALVAWIAPAVWTIMQARQAIETGTGLERIVSAGGVAVGPSAALRDAIVSAVMTEGPEAFGSILAAVEVR